jgi:hypothetical protein
MPTHIVVSQGYSNIQLEKLLRLTKKDGQIWINRYKILIRLQKLEILMYRLVYIPEILYET